MIIILLIVVFGIIGIVQIKKLIQKKYYKEMAIFCICLAASFVISVLYAAGVELPSPAHLLQSFLQSINLHF